MIDLSHISAAPVQFVNAHIITDDDGKRSAQVNYTVHGVWQSPVTLDLERLCFTPFGKDDIILGAIWERLEAAAPAVCHAIFMSAVSPDVSASAWSGDVSGAVVLPQSAHSNLGGATQTPTPALAESLARPLAELAQQPYLPPVMSDVVIDLYHGDNVKSFIRAKASGIAAVILKASQGATFDDPVFQKRMMQVVAAGLLPGAYHFFDGSDPERQVRHFANDVMATKVPGILRCVDFEPTIPDRALENALAIFVANAGPLVLYAGRWAFPVINPVLQRCALFLPEYGNRPICPPGWDRFELWQHTDGQVGSGVVPVPGIGRCDRSRFAGTVEELRLWWANPVRR